MSKLGGLAKVALYGGGIVSFCLACNVVQMITLPLFKIKPKQAKNLNSTLAGTVWYCIQTVFEKKHKAKITYSGDSIPEKENAIVIVNHRSYDDFLLVNSVAFRKGMIKSLKYFAKDSLKFLPAFGWGMYLMGQIFVKRNWTSDQKSINKAYGNIKKEKEPVWIIMYLEGTRINAQKLIQSHEFARKRNLPILNNVLLPRTKGLKATLNAFRNSHVKYVYDFTLVYQHKEKGFAVLPSVAKILSEDLSDYQFHVHIRRIPMEDIPEDENEINEWAIQLYKDKDDLLEEMKHNWTNNIQLIDDDEMKWLGLRIERNKNKKELRFLE